EGRRGQGAWLQEKKEGGSEEVGVWALPGGEEQPGDREEGDAQDRAVGLGQDDTQVGQGGQGGEAPFAEPQGRRKTGSLRLRRLLHEAGDYTSSPASARSS